MTRARISLVALVLALSYPAQADEAGEKLVRDYIAALDANPQWSSSAKSIRSDGTKVIVEGWTASLESGGLKETNDKIVLDGVSAGRSGGLAAKNWSAQNTKVESAAVSVSIPQWTATDLAAPLIPSISVDPSKPFSSLATYYRLVADLSFGRIDIPTFTLSQSFDVPGSDGRTSRVTSTGIYNGLTLEHAENGKVDRVTLASFSASTSMPPPSTGAWKVDYGKAEALGIDLGAIAHVFDPSAYKDGKGDGLWRETIKSYTFDKVSATLDGKTVFSTGQWAFRGFRMRQTLRPISEILDRLLTSPPPDETKAIAFITEDAPSLVGFYGFDEFSVVDARGGEPSTAQFELDRFVATGFSEAGLKRIAIEGLSGGGPQFGGAMKLFAIEDIEWPKLSALTNYAKFIMSRSNGSTSDPAAAAEYADSFLNFYPKYARIIIDGLSGGPPNQEPVRMGRYVANVTGHFGSIPASYDAEIDSVVIPGWVLRLDPSSAQFFDALGYDKLELKLRSTSAVDAASGSAKGNTSFDAASAGALSLDVAMGGMTEPNVRAAMVPFLTATTGNPDMPQILVAVAPFSFDGFKLRFDDASLTKRLLGFFAKMQGMDEQTLIGNVSAMLQLGLSELKHPAFTEQVVNAVKAYLSAPKSLTVEAKPATPVKAAQLMSLDPQNPGAAIDLLGVTVRSND